MPSLVKRGHPPGGMIETHGWTWMGVRFGKVGVACARCAQRFCADIWQRQGSFPSKVSKTMSINRAQSSFCKVLSVMNKKSSRSIDITPPFSAISGGIL